MIWEGCKCEWCCIWKQRAMINKAVRCPECGATAYTCKECEKIIKKDCDCSFHFEERSQEAINDKQEKSPGA